jgi:heme A synthase
MHILASLALFVLIFLSISDAWNEKDETRRIKKVFLAYAIGIMALLLIFIR